MLARGMRRDSLVIAWKQYNDGTTFIAAPYPLAWLEVNGARWVDTSDPNHTVQSRDSHAIAA